MKRRRKKRSKRKKRKEQEEEEERRRKKKEIIVKIFLSFTPSLLPSLSLYLAPNLSLCLPCVYTVASVYKSGRKFSLETVFEPPASRTKKNKSLNHLVHDYFVTVSQWDKDTEHGFRIPKVPISPSVHCNHPRHPQSGLQNCCCKHLHLVPGLPASLLQIISWLLLICHGLSTLCCFLCTFFYVKLAITYIFVISFF